MALSFTKEEFITGDRFLRLAQTNTDRIRYIKTDVLYAGGRPINWRGVVHGATPALCWITGHSDYPIVAPVYDRFKPACTHWFAVNAVHDAPALHPIPLGITNDCADSPIHRIYGNLDVMLEVMQDTTIPPADRPVYMNFQSATYPVERERVWNLFKEKPWVTIGTHAATLEGRRAFLREIRAHRFVLCPRGNGVDTHRLWETLYMGSIPIVIRHPALRNFTDLPIAWIDDWAEVTPEWLETEYSRIRATAPTFPHPKLRMSYWVQKIRDHCN